jgi:geranylgeranyl diphosphate synthase type II
VSVLKETITIQQIVAEKAKQVEAALDKALPVHWDVPAKLRESMQYSLMAGGKRLRPVFVLLAAEALGGTERAAMPAACAIEMIHTYSLVHDDLPAMDNDDYRRGKPTNHKIYGEAMAILAGDGLLTHAFHVVSDAGRQGLLSPESAIAIVAELSQLAGASGMVGGQAADVLGEQGITSREELDYIHRHKTGDLIVFSLRAGGWAAGATEAQLEALTRFGYAIGLAFQIQDDILDIEGDEQKLGKAVNSDEKQQKVTYPFLIGMAASKQKVRDLTEDAKAAISGGVIPHPESLMALADYLVKRDH